MNLDTGMLPLPLKRYNKEEEAKTRSERMIAVKVANLSISNVGFVLLLRSLTDERTLPIFIGVPEAQSIALFLNDVEPPRPMTHDMMKNLLDVLDARVDHVEVSSLDDGTFYATLILAVKGQSLHVDSRPSDAIALALRTHAAIYVANEVMDKAGIVMPDDEEEEPREPVLKEPVQELREELQKAVNEERYEDAARLRDAIQKNTTSN
jgi:bifunctional DNase/RNase